MLLIDRLTPQTSMATPFLRNKNKLRGSVLRDTDGCRQAARNPLGYRTHFVVIYLIRTFPDVVVAAVPPASLPPLPVTGQAVVPSLIVGESEL